MFEDAVRNVDFEPAELDLPLLAEHLQLVRITVVGQQVGLFYLQSGGDQLFIADFEIQRFRRGLGFGTAAINKLAELGRAAGFKRLTGRIEGEVSKDIDKLVRWYGKRGFEVTRHGDEASICMSLDESKPAA